jgi:hypothetical protein
VRSCDRDLARAVFLILLVLYTATFVGVPELPDGELEFQGTSALARSGSLALAGTPEAQLAAEHLARDPRPGALPVRRGAGARADRVYSWYGVGQAAAAVPLYAVGRSARWLLPEVEARHRALGIDGHPASEYFEHVLVGWRNPLLGAATAALLLLCARRLGCERKRAFWAALAYGVTSFAWPQARSSLSDVQAAFWLLLAFHLLLRMREGFERFELPRARVLLGLGGALGMALLTRVAVLPACLVVGVAAEVQLRAGFRALRVSRWAQAQARRTHTVWRAAAVLAGPFLACVVVLLVTNAVRFGDALDPGYGRVLRGGFFGGDPLAGLAGLCVSPGRGLLWMAPLVVVAPLGLWRAWSDGLRLPCLVACGVLAACLAVAAPLRGWGGAWTYGPRYLLPALPFLWLGVARAFGTPRGSRAWRWVLLAGAAFGLVVQFPGTLVDHTTAQDLAVRTARDVWPLPDLPEEDAEAQRFENMQWHWGFAAPWVHWRILRRRAAGLGADYPPHEIFGTGESASLASSGPRQHGFLHWAWVDARERLGLTVWPVGLVLLGLLGLGLWCAARGFDEARG